MSVRRIGSGAAFATTRLGQQDEWRSSRNGQRGSGNGKRDDFVRQLNCPTQAKTRDKDGALSDGPPLGLVSLLTFRRNGG